jgi:hypothetical protein
MAQGHPAVELPGEDLLAQYPAHQRADRTQPFANVEQHTAFQTKALTDPQRFGRGEHLRSKLREWLISSDGAYTAIPRLIGFSGKRPRS